MSTKKYIKAHSDDPVEKATGNKLYEVDGQLGCRVTQNSRMLFNGKQHMARYVAASIYTATPISDLGEVETTCGVKNCMLPSHILINNKHLSIDDNGNVSSTEIDPDAPDENGDIHGIHPDVWPNFNEYQHSLARTGKYTQVEIGFRPAPVAE